MRSLKFFLLFFFLFSWGIAFCANCTLSAGNNASVCLNQGLVLNATATGNPSVTWTSNPTGGISSGGNTLTPTINTGTAQVYMLIVTGDTLQCADTVIVTVNPLPNSPPISTTHDNSCTGTAMGFSTPPIAGMSYSWNFGDGGTASGASVSHTYNAPAGNGSISYNVILTAIANGTNCQSTSSVAWVRRSN